MELYILFAIIWLGGVIFCGFWFVYLPWVALKLLFKDV